MIKEIEEIVETEEIKKIRFINRKRKKLIKSKMKL